MIIVNIVVLKRQCMNTCKIIAMNIDKSAKAPLPLVSFNPDSCKVLSLNNYVKKINLNGYKADKLEACKLVNLVMKNQSEKSVLEAVNGGLVADAPNFMLNLSQRVEKLTTHKQKQFLDNFSFILKRQSPNFFIELITNSEKTLSSNDGLRKFCYHLKRMLVLVKKTDKNPQKLLIV